MAEYKVLKAFGEVVEGDIITTDSFTDEERAERITDGSIALITAAEDVKTDEKSTNEVDANVEADTEKKDIDASSETDTTAGADATAEESKTE